MLSADFGKFGEEATCNEYLSRGYKLLDRNYRTFAYKQTGELDLVFKKGKELIFVEVKSRKDDKFMQPEESIDFRKQRKLLKACKAYLQKHPEYSNFFARIDISVVRPSLDPKKVKVYIMEDVIQDTA